VEDELRALYALGVDAVFTDHPGTAVRVRDVMAGARE
jgi:glycerophosphoryl diester phosphodiesterase